MKLREANIARNNARLISLGLATLPTYNEATPAKQTPSKRLKQASSSKKAFSGIFCQDVATPIGTTTQ
jgi:hypothetical protein